jgi:hypothetical protein
MAKDPYQHLAYFLNRLHRLRSYVEFSEANWQEKLASYNRSLANDELNLKSSVAGGITGLILRMNFLSTTGRHHF